MTARPIQGSVVAAALRADVADEVGRLTTRLGRSVGLATVLVGADPASEVYVRNKRRAAVEAGFTDIHRRLPGDATEADVRRVLIELADDPDVTGILLQLPLPAAFDHRALLDLIPPSKDVDGLTTTSAGLLQRGLSGLRPCTPSGIIRLIDSVRWDLDGASAVVVGRSELVGLPLARMLTLRNATVTVAHSHTRDLARVTATADVLIVAAGVPGLIGADHVAPGSLVVDVGIHRHGDVLVGDVRFDEVIGRAGWLTPVPGGVGPMTIACLLANTLQAAQMQWEPDSAPSHVGLP